MPSTFLTQLLISFVMLTLHYIGNLSFIVISCYKPAAHQIVVQAYLNGCQMFRAHETKQFRAQGQSVMNCEAQSLLSEPECTRFQ